MLFLDAGAQQYCNANCNDTLRDESTIHYIPDEYTTMKYVKVNFQVSVEVTTASGGTVQTFNTPTPNGMQL